MDEHVRTTTQHTRGIAEAAAVNMEPAVSEEAGMTDTAMNTIADMIYTRFIKGKDKA